MARRDTIDIQSRIASEQELVAARATPDGRASIFASRRSRSRSRLTEKGAYCNGASNPSVTNLPQTGVANA
jgi:hypothetical protein